MKLIRAKNPERQEKITEDDLSMTFPEPELPLLEGPGESCSWDECMRQTAAQTNYWIRNFGHEPPPPAWEERFVLE
ncbi:MAG: hypothetical protein CMO55_09370 [Verrucomicrobiales bacterium]|nr:hypothetical protein [Verrucomicrobiales bacterium]